MHVNVIEKCDIHVGKYVHLILGQEMGDGPSKKWAWRVVIFIKV